MDTYVANAGGSTFNHFYTDTAHDTIHHFMSCLLIENKTHGNFNKVNIATKLNSQTLNF